MGVSKVVYGSNTLIDLTGDTVTAADLMQGKTAHGADGEAIVGTYVPSTETAILAWTNPSPTATFTGRDVTLSEAFANGTTPTAKGLKIIYKRTTSASAAQYELEIRFGSDLTNYIYGNSVALYALSFNVPGSYRAFRGFGIVNDNTLHFLANTRSNSTSTYNDQLIPLEIYVIK